MSAPILGFRAGAGDLVVDLDLLVRSRLLVQANSGGGKSRAIRSLAEQTHGRIQQLIIDPEGEFASLRERFDYVLAGKEGDVPAEPKTAKLLCRRLVELGASAVIDLYELPLPDRRRFVRVFLEELMHLPRALWRPLLVVVDEAHLFAPEHGAGESESTAAVISLCTQGRKRGFAAVLATQRIAKLHKDAAAELLNKLVGRTGLDVDVRRAGDDLGFDKAQRQDLKTLAPGEFYAYGPAISREVALVRTGEVLTTHPEPGKVAPPAPPAPDSVRKLLAQLQDLPAQAAEEARTLQEAQARIRSLEGELRRAARPAPAGPAAPAAPDPRAIARAVEAETRPLNNRIRELERSTTAQVEAAVRPLRTQVAHFQRRIEKAGRIAEQLVAALRNGDGKPAEIPFSVKREDRAAPLISGGEIGHTPARAAPAPRRPEPVELAEGVTRPQQRILDAVATLEALGVAPASNEAVAAIAGYTPGTGHYNNVRSSLVSAGLLTYPGGNLLELTDAGRELARARDDVRTLEDLHRAWLDLLDGPQRRILSELLAVYPESLSHEDLAARSGYTPGTGHFNNTRGSLRTIGAIEYFPRKGWVRASPLLFPDGLV